MKSALLGLCGGLLLAISAIAGEQPRDSWFIALDTNNDGGISLNELQSMRYERFTVVDVNQNRELSRDEVANNATWSERFVRLDENADGRVTLAEFENSGRSRFTVIDIDGNGRITAHEALNFQRKVRKYNPQTKSTG